MAGGSKTRIGKFLIATSISVGIALLVVMLYYVFPRTRILRTLESASVNWRFLFRSLVTGYFPDSRGVVNRPREGIYDRIVVAAIDDATIDTYGGTFPFDRQVWADMLNSFNRRPSRNIPAVFFDIFFSDKSQNPKSDAAMIKAFRDYQGLLGEDFIFDIIRGEDILFRGSEEDIQRARTKLYSQYALDYNTNTVRAMRRFELDIRENLNVRRYPKATPILAELAESLDFLGAANQGTDESTYRFKPLIVQGQFKKMENGQEVFVRKYYPSVVLAMLVKLLDSDLSNVTAQPGSVVVRNALWNGKRGDFRIPVDERYQLSINFKSTPGGGYIRTVPFKDITKASLPKDAIVFIGMYSRKGTHDIWLSPMGDMYGVEILAYALGTVYNRDFLTDTPDWINILSVFLAAVLVGLLISGGNRVSAALGVTVMIASFAAGFALFFQNIRFVTFLPMITTVLTLIAVQIFILLTEGREKKFIKSTFSSYLNPKLVDILIQNPDMLNLGGEDREVTVLFSGVKGLDHVAEKLSPRELVDYLNVYFSRMADIVMDTNGTLDKYIGDAVMAFWNAPVDLADHALKACEAAVRMTQALESFNEEMKAKGHKPITVHIGVNTGRIIVGNVGSDQQKNYTAIGDSVNLSSRLKGLNKFFHTNIVVSEFTYELVKDRVIARELDLTKVKGKTKPVRIYEILDIKSPA